MLLSGRQLWAEFHYFTFNGIYISLFLVGGFVNTIGWIGSRHIYKVVDAMAHAVTSTQPKLRYVIGWDHTILWRTLSYLPSEIQDLAFFIYHNPKEFPTITNAHYNDLSNPLVCNPDQS